MSEQSQRSVLIRPIRVGDDPKVAGIIRTVLGSFGGDVEGSAYGDAEIEAMSMAYGSAEAQYYVVEVEGEVEGCGGFARLSGTSPEEGVCELRKMYLLPQARGLGIGRQLSVFLLQEMRSRGYTKVYLETMANMEAAQGLYLSLGFKRLDRPLGKTGHCACDHYYARDL